MKEKIFHATGLSPFCDTEYCKMQVLMSGIHKFFFRNAAFTHAVHGLVQAMHKSLIISNSVLKLSGNLDEKIQILNDKLNSTSY
jgi:hypothetical protein